MRLILKYLEGEIFYGSSLIYTHLMDYFNDDNRKNKSSIYQPDGQNRKQKVSNQPNILNNQNNQL